MAKGTWYRVESAPNAAGVRTLAEGGRTVALAPGKWRARLVRHGLADEVVAGTSDTLRAAIAVGDKNATGAAKGQESSVIAARMPIVELVFEVPAEGKLPLSVSLVMDRGQAPDIIEEFRTQVIAKAPAGTTPAIVTAALTAAFPDVAIAVAVASFVAAADRIMTACFGPSIALARPIEVVSTPGATAPQTLCMTRLPARNSINVGVVPGPNAFGLGGDGAFVETHRDRGMMIESVHTGWVEAQRSYVVLELSPVV